MIWILQAYILLLRVKIKKEPPAEGWLPEQN